MGKYLLLLSCVLCSYLLGMNRVSIGAFDKTNVGKWSFWQSSNPSYPSIKLESKWVWPDQVSAYCGKVTFFRYQAVKPRMQSYPGLLMDKNLRYRNWSNGIALSCETYAEEEGELSLTVYLKNGQWYRKMGEKIPRGRGLLRFTFDSALKMTDVSSVLIWQCCPRKDWTVYLGEVFLEERDTATLRARLQESLKEYAVQDFSALTASERVKASKIMERIPAAMARFQVDDMTFLTDAETMLRRLKQKSSLLSEDKDGEVLVRWVSSLEKVHRTQQSFLNYPKKTWCIDVARGEGEGCQVAVYPRRNVLDACVKLGMLPQSANGVSLPVSAVSLRPVGYVYCSTPKSWAEAPFPRWRPDPILDYGEVFTLQKERWQSYYLDVIVPENQAPGLYHGTIELWEAQQRLGSYAYAVQVRPFVLKKGVPYFMANNMGSNLYMHNWDPVDFPRENRSEQERNYKKLLDLFLAHRMNPDHIYNARVRHSVEETRYILNQGGCGFNLRFLISSKLDQKGSIAYAKSFLAGERSRIKAFQQAGIWDKCYIYGYDEAPETYLETIQTVATEIRRQYPEIKIITTAQDHTFGGDGRLTSADTYCPTIEEFEKNLQNVRAAQKAGRKVMWYIACGPDAPYPNFFIDFPLSDARLLMGMMYWKYRPDGFLYYSLARWGKYQHDEKGMSVWIPQGTIAGVPLTSWDPMSFPGFNGDGSLVYPSGTGPIPSLRLKAIRDGLDDYMYFKLLEEAYQEVAAGKVAMPSQWKHATSQALTIEKELVTTLRDYTKDPERITKKRKQVADLLSDYIDAKNTK